MVEKTDANEYKILNQSTTSVKNHIVYEKSYRQGDLTVAELQARIAIFQIDKKNVVCIRKLATLKKNKLVTKR